MSWSSNREKEAGVPLSVRRERLRQIDLVLQKLAADEDLHDDLLLPEVEKAINHWTGAKRLPPEEAVALQDHRRVVYVLQQIQLLQAQCKQAQIPVPFELFLNRCPGVPDELARRLFGADIIPSEAEIATIAEKTSKSEKTSTKAADSTKTFEEDFAQKAEAAAAAIKASVKSEKLPDNLADAPPSDASMLTWLSILVVFIAFIIYFA